MKPTRPLILIATLLCSTAISVAPAQAADALDRSFGDDGLVLPGVKGTAPAALVEDGEGGVVGVGPNFYLFRFRADGSRDEAWGDDGELISPLGEGSRVTDMALTYREDLLTSAAGFSGRFVVGAFHSDGSTDRAFGEAGHAGAGNGRRGHASGAHAIASRPDGGVLAAGYGVHRHRRWKASVLALRGDGSRDFGFGDHGRVSFGAPGETPIAFTDIAVLPDGRIRAFGSEGGRLLVVGLLANGHPDPGFGGGDGRVLIDVGAAPGCACAVSTRLAIDAQGRIVAAANVVSGAEVSVAVIRLRSDGGRDPGFGNDGVLRVRHGERLGARDLSIQRNGKIVVAGFTLARQESPPKAAILRLLPDGQPDAAFGPGGFFTKGFGYEAVATALLPRRNGQLVVGGRANPKEPSLIEGSSIWETAEVFLLRFRP